jgi:hypothetical protein
VPFGDPSVLAVIATLDERSVVVAVFNDRMVPERVQPFWAALQRGEFITDAAAEVGTYRKKGTAVGGRRRRGASSPRSRPEGSLPGVL